MRVLSIHGLRLASGLVMLAFVTGHLLNHAAGIVSIPAMNDLLWLSIAPWRTLPGTVLLLGAIVVHIAIALWMLWHRRNLRLHGWEVAQYTLGFLIPVLLAQHVLGTRVSVEALGIRTDYRYVLVALWVADPKSALIQAIALLVVWGHGMIGLHFWLRVRPWYPRFAPLGLALAVLIPALALAGHVAAGVEARSLARTDPDWVQQVLDWARYRPEVARFVDDTTTQVQAGFLAAILAILAARGGRSLWRRRRGRARLHYRDGATIDIEPGATALEAIRAAGIPHAAVCGGRGRCSTCRVRVGDGADHLAPPDEREARVLERIGAPADVRLACQIRPVRDLEVTPLLPPGASAREGFRRPRWLAGDEREIAVLFADMRGFTRMADQRLPYDTVFVLNRWFATLGQAVEQSGGRLDKFIGDGVMALFGIEAGAADGARRALDCAARMADGVEALNEALTGELRHPLRIGIGIHVGPAIVGEMGWGTAKTLTAIGDAVNTASRLETLTKEFDAQLVVSGAAAAVAGLDTGSWTRHETPIRGKALPITVYAAADARGLAPAP